MPSINALVKTDPVNVPVADPGKMNWFIGLDNIARGRDELNQLFVFDPSVAAALGNANPVGQVVIDGAPEPTAIGMVMATTSIGPNLGGFVDPRVAKVSTTVLQLNPPLVADGPAVLDELVLVDLVTAAADVEVTLPAPVVDREVWVKIDSDGFPINGFKVVIEPGAALVDGFASGSGGILEIVTNRGWLKMRGHRDGVNWIVVG